MKPKEIITDFLDVFESDPIFTEQSAMYNEDFLVDQVSEWQQTKDLCEYFISLF
jgi:hypothetical protein